MRGTGKNVNLQMTSQRCHKREFNKAFTSSCYTYVPFLRRESRNVYITLLFLFRPMKPLKNEEKRISKIAFPPHYPTETHPREHFYCCQDF